MVFAMGTASDADEHFKNGLAPRQHWPLPVMAAGNKYAEPLLMQSSQSVPRDWVLSAIDFDGQEIKN